MRRCKEGHFMKTKQQFIGLLLAAIVLGGPLGRALLGGGITYTYDAAGRLLSANYGAGHSASYAYDDAGNMLLSSAPSPAIVVGPLIAGQLTLSWPAIPVGFALQKSPTLGPTASWSAVTAAQTQNGNIISANVSVGDGTEFYRLEK
jgi:hypothetical protein